jgi:endonuclease/exonuclease/phosphatase family metal-dependent hydrolase
VRVATFNILHGRSPVDGRVDVDRFADAIRTLDADVLGLQEVDRDQKRSGGADLTAVAAEAMGAVDCRFVAAMSGTPGGSWQAATGHERAGSPAYGIALLSRYPARDWGELRLPTLPVRVPYRFPDQPRPHLVRDETRLAIRATVATPIGDVVVATTHLSYLPGWNVVQLRRLVRALGHDPSPGILMGDLNLTSRPAHRVTAMLPLATGPTFPAARPGRQIDHILGRDVPVGEMGRPVALPLSDHRALVVDLPFG